MILPLPSSPHWAPTRIVLAMCVCAVRRQQKCPGGKLGAAEAGIYSGNLESVHPASQSPRHREETVLAWTKRMSPALPPVHLPSTTTSVPTLANVTRWLPRSPTTRARSPVR